MPWLQIIQFFIKYGLTIVQLVKAIWEMVDWIRARDNKVTFSGKMISRNLDAMAKKAKANKDLSELKMVRDALAKRKAELEKESNA